MAKRRARKPEALYDPRLISLLGIPENKPPKEVKKYFKAVTQSTCKPCWELKYCPYGPLVEQFPLPRLTRQDAIEYIEHLKAELKQGGYKGEKKKMFASEVANFDESKVPVAIPEEEELMRCTIFGHFCPVFFSAEGFTETRISRRTQRYIPFQTKLRVARRDNYCCQECGKLLHEGELEFDHIIPYGLGGTSDEHNIRLTCRKCNRKKGKLIPLWNDPDAPVPEFPRNGG